jgi:hypothetical protein
MIVLYIYDSILYCFDDSTGLWTESEEVMFNIISRYNDQLYLLTLNKKGEIKKTFKGYGNSTTLQRMMLPQLKSLCINNSWLINNYPDDNKLGIRGNKNGSWTDTNFWIDHDGNVGIRNKLVTSNDLLLNSGKVIDFGSAFLRPTDEKTPAIIKTCIVTDVKSIGADVLGAGAKVRATASGMICGINGYPAKECGIEVDTPKALLPKKKS